MSDRNVLSPVAFLERAADVFRDRVAIIDGVRRLTYGEFRDRGRRLAFVLGEFGVRPGDRIAVLCANSHVMLEAHYAVPAASAVLVTLNTRLSEDEHLHQI
jgi:fatty-acyl-CoA synthase